MAKVTLEERRAIARRRLVRVLRTHGIANWRTLEQKISDAGPGHLRVDPHILTRVRRDLETEGVILRHVHAGAPWFSLHDTPPETIQARIEQQLPIYVALQGENFKKRQGQALEIAIARALQAQSDLPDYLGHFPALDAHDDGRLYSKEEPPKNLSTRTIGGDRRLDFLARHPSAGWAGLEAKNVREWLYPHRVEITDLLSKCIALDVVPVLIARRIHFSTFVVLNPCGVVLHQTFNQLFPAADSALADRAKHKDNLGYHDIRIGNLPDKRLSAFITHHLPNVLPEQRAKFDGFKDIITRYVEKEIDYAEFAARVRRRRLGRNEDHDWDDGLPEF